MRTVCLFDGGIDKRSAQRTLRIPTMPEPNDSSDTRIRWALVLVAAFTVIGAGLRFWGLGASDFWFDESCTFIYVHNLFDWPEESNLLVESTNLPYYFVLRGWAFLFGDSEVGYRSMSALLGTLTIPLLGLIAGRLGGLIAGVVCAAIVAFNPLHIHYSHEARAYAMWLFLLVGTLWLLLEAGRRIRGKWWIAYGVAVLACLHLHYFTMYWVPATVAIVYLAQDRRQALSQWLLTNVVVAVLFIPYFLAAVWPAARGGGSGWVLGNWEPLTAIPRTLWAFLPAGGYPGHLRGLSILSSDTVKLGPEWLTAAARTIPAVLLLTIALYLLRRRLLQPRNAGINDRSAQQTLRGHVFAAGMTLGPLILGWGYSILVRPNYLVGRYDLVAWPACMVWLALIISSVGRRVEKGSGTFCLKGPQGASHKRFPTPFRSGRPALAICVPLLVCSLVPIARMASSEPGPTPENRRAQRLAELSSARDLAITFSYDRDYLLYYLHRTGFTGRILGFPSWINQQVGWVDLEPDMTPDKVASLTEDAVAFVEKIDAVIDQGGRVWLLLDSHEHRVDPQGNSISWPRALINRFLMDGLVEAGVQIDRVDSELLIFNLHR